MIKKRLGPVFVVFLLIFLLLSGCAPQDKTKVKGIKERGKYKEEPQITVELPTGEKKTMPVEEYIEGVVAGEMKSGWPENAYGAQAIIARTFALEFMERNDTRVISSDFKQSQAYKPDSVTDKIKKAVKKTRGMVAIYNGEFIRAWFHASAGGQTTSAKVGLAFKDEEPPYIKKVKSPDDQAPADIKNWSASFSTQEIRQAVKKLTGTDVGAIKKFTIDQKDDTGRAINFVIEGDKGTKTVKAAELRNSLDPVKLKSTKIKSLKLSDGRVTFSGSGFGHGVGMSQWGAYAMAKEGKKPEDIIKYYFKDIEIEKLWD